MSAITYGKRNKIPTSTLGIFTLPIPTSTDDVRFVQPLTGLKHDLKSLASPIKQTPAISIKKSPTRKRKSPIKKTTTRKRKSPIKKTTSRFEDEESHKKLPTIFEREQANTFLDSITNEERMRDTISTMSKMGEENMRKMIRYGTDIKRVKTITPIQKIFLRSLDIKLKNENPYTRMIHKVPVAKEKINWTSRESSLPRGVIVIAHTHGGFEQSHDLIKYPTDTNNKKLESVSIFYLSDIGSGVCGINEEFKNFDDEFIRSFLKGPLEEGISIKDISYKAQESLKSTKWLKTPKEFIKDRKEGENGILENYFEAGVYNLAVSTKTNNIPFLNKKYTCGANPKLPSKLMDILVVTDDRLIPLRDIIAREPTFDCKNDYSSITTLQLVDELSKVIDDLEHVIIIDTSCSKFTPSIIKELFKEMPHESTPHKHRKTGLLRTMTPSPDKSIKTKQTKTEIQLKKEARKRKLKKIQTELGPYFNELHGGKKTKKRRHGRRYKKTKKN